MTNDAQETYSMGSSFEDFLEEEGLLAEAEASAIKRVLAYQFEQAIKNANISKAEMAKRMHTNQASVEKLINPDAISLNTLTKAAATLGMHLKMTLETYTLEQTAK
ncbi:MAG: XRE family transcriptional regulator [Pseudomonadota bacterium]